MQALDFSNINAFKDKVKFMRLMDHDEYEVSNIERSQFLRELNFFYLTNKDRPLISSFENLVQLEIQFLLLDKLPEFLFTGLTKLKEWSLTLKDAIINVNLYFQGHV